MATARRHRDEKSKHKSMSRTKITTVGELGRAKDGALAYSLYIQEVDKTFWLESLANTKNWPTLGRFPERPKNDPPRYRSPEYATWKVKYDAAMAEWNRASEEYTRALHADASYIEAASQFEQKVQKQPEFLPFWGFIKENPYLREQILKNKKGQFAIFAYRGKIIRVDSTDPEVFQTHENTLVITGIGLAQIMQYVIRREKRYEHMLRELEAFENMEKLEGIPREPIPESVRLFVWQRDKGQCVKCGSRERLEFDHVIPIVAGGSNTERNIQLLCEPCNRSKGSTI
jgi:HNH endonuclease